MATGRRCLDIYEGFLSPPSFPLPNDLDLGTRRATLCPAFRNFSKLAPILDEIDAPGLLARPCRATAVVLPGQDSTPKVRARAVGQRKFMHEVDAYGFPYFYRTFEVYSPPPQVKPLLAPLFAKRQAARRSDVGAREKGRLSICNRRLPFLFRGGRSPRLHVSMPCLGVDFPCVTISVLSWRCRRSLSHVTLWPVFRGSRHHLPFFFFFFF